MDTHTFVSMYREAFGQAAPLPLIFYYSDSPAAETEKVPGCFLRYLPAALGGTPVSLSTDNMTCGGGKFYAGFTPMPDHVPVFVSEKEKYKSCPDLVKAYLDTSGPVRTGKKYLNFIRVDKAASFDGMEGLLFLASPDVISGLCSWAFYDSNDPQTVSLVFGSGCSSIVALLVFLESIVLLCGRRLFKSISRKVSGHVSMHSKACASWPQVQC